MKKRSIRALSFWLGTRESQLEMGDVKTKKEGEGQGQEGSSKSTP